VERVPQKPHLVALTGVLRLWHERNLVARELWKEIFPIKHGCIDCGSFQIVEGNNHKTLLVRTTQHLNDDIEMTFVAAKGSGVPNFHLNKWWIGDKFVDGDYVQMVFVKLDSASNESETSESVSSVSEKKFFNSTEEEPSHGHYVASIRLNGKLIGPYDVQIMCNRFFIVDGQTDMFWVYLHGDNLSKMATYNQFYSEARERKMSKGEFQRYERGWMRYVVDDKSV
jgi:hypothetical protein